MASLGLRARGAEAKAEKDWTALWEEDGDGETEGGETQSLWEAEVAAIWVEGRSFEGSEGVDGEAGRSDAELGAASPAPRR
jgi:hypothetical protein